MVNHSPSTSKENFNKIILKDYPNEPMGNNRAMINMKQLVKKSLIVLCMALLAFTYSCSKSSSVDPNSSSNLKVTDCIYMHNNNNHAYKIRFALQNKSDLRLYYCKVTIVINDDSSEVFRRTYEIGSKYNQSCILAAHETQWSDWYDTDFYVFHNASYAGYVQEALFY